jgi:hypothetical protein
MSVQARFATTGINHISGEHMAKRKKAHASARAIYDAAFHRTVQKNLKAPVLTMLEMPMSAEHQQVVKALKLKPGDIMYKGEMSGPAVDSLTWFCSISLPTDCDAGIDG